MSATSDVTNGLVLAGEGFGYNYGIQSLPALAPPGTRKMRIAFRGWIDGDFSGVWRFVSEDYYSNSAWGLSWLPQVPYQNDEGLYGSTTDPLPNTKNPETFAGFIGPFAMNAAYNSYFTRNYTLNEVINPTTEGLTTSGGDWAKDGGDQVVAIYGFYGGLSNYQNSYFMNGRSLTDGTLNVPNPAGYHTYYMSSGEEKDMLHVLPYGSAYGNQVTIGWEFSANELNEDITFRFFWDAESLAENNLISCFDSSPRLTEPNFSTGGAQWRPDISTFNWPTYFLMRNGLPTATMTLKAYTVAYYDINGDPLL